MAAVGMGPYNNGYQAPQTMTTQPVRTSSGSPISKNSSRNPWSMDPSFNEAVMSGNPGNGSPGNGSLPPLIQPMQAPAPINYGSDPWSYPGNPPAFVNGNQQSLYNNMAQKLGSINLDKSGLNAYSSEAMRQGPSRYATMADQQQNQLASQAQSGAANQAAGQGQQAKNYLAMRGGLDSGARERSATNQNNNYMNLTQGVNQGNANNQSQIAMNDEQNRISQLGALPGMEVQSLNPAFQQAQLMGQAQQFDLGQQANQATAQNAYNYGMYDTRMKAWGAGQQANATQNASNNQGGSSFICTALSNHGLMNIRERAKMTRFMLRAIPKFSRFFFWYFRNAELAVDLAEQQKFNFAEIKKSFVDEILELENRCGYDKAAVIYCKRASKFVKLFTGKEYSGVDTKISGYLYFPLLFTLPQVWKFVLKNRTKLFTRKQAFA